jgi:hypothetical protein
MLGCVPAFDMPRKTEPATMRLYNDSSHTSLGYMPTRVALQPLSTGVNPCW